MSLPDRMIEPLVRAALLEDLGGVGDITSNALVTEDRLWKAALVARQAGTVAGMDLARLAFQIMDQDACFESVLQDGACVESGDVLARVSGKARALLAAERTALNFLSHLSGIASLTARFVEAVKPYKARISCTRKTTPTLRALEKYAVRMGGGSNHRSGLYDAVLIKDNHIALMGDIHAAAQSARQAVGPSVKVEVEVDMLDQLRLLLEAPIDAVLLDNMTPVELAQAVALVAGRFEVEASGGVSLDNVNAIAACGVDVISIGRITHSAPILDIGLDAA